jgi:hypothetical protein
MDELTLALRQHSQAFRPTEDALQRVVRRGTRRQRVRRIGSAAVALVLFALVDLGLLRGLSPTHSTVTPGGPATDPSGRTTQTHQTVPGSGGRSTSVTDRPVGSGSRVIREIGDQPGSSHPSLHPGQVGQGGAPGATITDEDTTPRPTFTQSPLEPTKTKGAANPMEGERAAPVQKDKHRGCATLKTKHARARCWARHHQRPPSVQVVGGPDTPSIVPADPGPPATDPTVTDPTVTDPTVTDPGTTDPVSSGAPAEGSIAPSPDATGDGATDPVVDGGVPEEAVAADGLVTDGTAEGTVAPAPDAGPA